VAGEELRVEIMHLALPVLRARGGSLVGFVIAMLAGVACTSTPAVDRSQLVADLVERLDSAEALTYTAEYELSGGVAVTVIRAQNPARLAVVYGRQKILISPDGITTCGPVGGRTRCTVSAPPAGSVAPGWPAAATAAGLPDPSAVTDRLAPASLDRNAVVDRRETTLIGHHASCVSVTGLSTGGPFNACVTSDGVLGSFSGTVDDRSVDLTLVRYSESVSAGAFDPPADAAVDPPRRYR
jgi:hypothetical protein